MNTLRKLMLAVLTGVQVLAAACSSRAEDTASTARVEPGDELSGGLVLVSEEAEPIAGSRPRLSISCNHNSRAFIYFGLVKPPPSPPPFRGLYAELKIDHGSPRRIEMRWGGETTWMPQSISDDADRRLAVELAGARSVTLDGLGPHASSPVRWSLDLPAGERQRFVAACTDRRAQQRAREAEARFQLERESDPIVLANRRRAQEANARLLDLYEVRKQRCANFEKAGYRSTACPPSPPVLAPVN